MKLFVVHKEGVYRHECGGVFSEYSRAVEAAIALASGDRDSYHAYEVRHYILNVVTQQDAVRQESYGQWGGDLVESDALFSTKKGAN